MRHDRIVAKLESLPEKDALNAIDELLGVDPSIIRNIQSYFIGILNKYQRGEGRAQRAEARKKEQQQSVREKWELLFCSLLQRFPSLRSLQNAFLFLTLFCFEIP